MKDSTCSFERLQIEAALLQSGCTHETLLETIKVLTEISRGALGYQRAGFCLKRWKSAVTDILAGTNSGSDRFDIYRSRMLSRSRHVL